jgi:Na+/H+-dicarboxylate symporter
VFAGFVVLGPRVFKLLKQIKEAFMLSFATASSEAAYPKILDALDRFGVKRKISSFVMPMGYSFNLDGSMMYCTFATLFIAQAYGIELPIATQITMLAILMLTSKGMAGVTARVAGGDRRDAEPVQHPGGGPAADPRCRRLP